MKASFQVITIVVFIAAAVFGVLVFSDVIHIGDDENEVFGTVVLWGTVRSDLISGPINEFNNANPSSTIRYVEKSPETFNQDLLEALASGVGPDMYFLPDNLAFSYANKLVTIPYSSYPLNVFKNTFAGAGEVFLTPNGTLAFPMIIDPLMLYYNRSMLDSNGVVYPPVTWSELVTFASLVTKKDDSNKITKSAVALGHFANVAHAKDILATLFMQAGNPIVSFESTSPQSALDNLNPKYSLDSMLQFYTDFADPVKAVYSWNRSFSNSTNTFSAEDLALYFGFASEFQSLVDRNPNHNFSVAPVPQIQGEASKLTNARVLGLAISSASKNFDTAFVVASKMATENFASDFSLALGIPPARRDLLTRKGTDAYSPVFYDSALFGKSWLDPSPKGTDDIFRIMVDRVLSNSLTLNEAINDAHAKLSLLLFR